MAKLKPEIQAFITRADAVRRKLKISRATLSKKLFEKRAGVIDNLANGKGCNITGWLEAQDKLAALEAQIEDEEHAVSA